MIGSGEGAESCWKRKRDPQWEKRFLGGRVCFNAGLSCAAVVVPCCWQHRSLECCLAVSHGALEKPLSCPPVCSWTYSCCSCSSHRETQQLSLGGRGAAGRIWHRLRWLPAAQSSVLPPPARAPAALLCCRVRLPSRTLPMLQPPAPVIAQQHLFALLCTPLCFIEGEVCLHFASLSEQWQGQKYGRWVGMREPGAWWICFSYLV